MQNAADPAKQLRSADIIGLMSPRPLWRLARGMVRAPFDQNFPGAPLAVCWFTNFSCNARCPFCCKAAEIRNALHRFPSLDLNGAKQLLERIRRTVDILYLSGGEPLLHPHLPEVLREAHRLEFASIGMSSNLITLDQRLEVLESLDALSVSIHSPDVASHATNLAVPTRTAQRVFDNLELIRQHPRRNKLKIIVNCVINRSNLATVPAMVEFTRQRGFLLEVVPANEHGRPPSELKGHPPYEALIDRLLAMRKAGKAQHLAGSTSYYHRIRTFEPFRCFPYGVPNVMPDGRLCTPCDVSGQYAVNVLDHPDLKTAIRESLPHLGKYPCRLGHCFKAGILERSRLFNILGRRAESATKN